MSNLKSHMKLTQQFLVVSKCMQEQTSLIAHLDQEWVNSKQNWPKYDNVPQTKIFNKYK